MGAPPRFLTGDYTTAGAQVAGKITGGGCKARFAKLDVTSEEEWQDVIRSTAGAYCVNFKHGDRNRKPSDLRLGRNLRFSGKLSYVRGSSAHIERDYFFHPREGRRISCA